VRDGLRICLTSDDRKTIPLVSHASVRALSLRLPAQPDGQNRGYLEILGSFWRDRRLRLKGWREAPKVEV
jgi:hypothetical protein